MKLSDTFEPDNTEEIKPGLFIQNKKGNYRQVNPIVWKGKWRLTKQFGWKNLVWIVIVLFLVFAYNADNKQLLEFHNAVVEDPFGFCNELIASLQTPECNEFERKHGLCLTNVGIDLTEVKVIDGLQNSNSVP